MTDLDLAAILARAERAYAAAKNDADDLGLAELTDATREHFEHDVPALIGAVRQLQQEKAELVTILGETRAELHAIGGMRVVEHEGHRLRVITVALHDRLCKARVASRQDTTPPVLHCHFCGFCYPPIAARPEQEGNDSRGTL